MSGRRQVERNQNFYIKARWVDASQPGGIWLNSLTVAQADIIIARQNNDTTVTTTATTPTVEDEGNNFFSILIPAADIDHIGNDDIVITPAGAIGQRFPIEVVAKLSVQALADIEETADDIHTDTQAIDLSNLVEKTDLPTNFDLLAINGSGHISQVTLVDTVTANSDTPDISGLTEKTDLPANLSLLSINGSGHIGRVVLVDTVTTNTDFVTPLDATQTQSAAEAAIDAKSLVNQTQLNARTLVANEYATSNEVTAITQNTRAVRVVPTKLKRPESGSTVYRVELFLYDSANNMEAPDSAPTLAVVNQSGNDRSSYLVSTTGTEVSTGYYRWTVNLPSTATINEQLYWLFTVVENSATRFYGNTSNIVDSIEENFTDSDRGLLTTVYDERLSTTRQGYIDKLNVAGTLAHSQDANTYKADVSSLALETTAQGIKERTDNLPDDPAAVGSVMEVGSDSIQSIDDSIGEKIFSGIVLGGNTGWVTVADPPAQLSTANTLTECLIEIIKLNGVRQYRWIKSHFMSSGNAGFNPDSDFVSAPAAGDTINIYRDRWNSNLSHWKGSIPSNISDGRVQTTDSPGVGTILTGISGLSTFDPEEHTVRVGEIEEGAISAAALHTTAVSKIWSVLSNSITTEGSVIKLIHDTLTRLWQMTRLRPSDSAPQFTAVALDLAHGEGGGGGGGVVEVSLFQDTAIAQLSGISGFQIRPHYPDKTGAIRLVQGDSYLAADNNAVPIVIENSTNQYNISSAASVLFRAVRSDIKVNPDTGVYDNVPDLKQIEGECNKITSSGDQLVLSLDLTTLDTLVLPGTYDVTITAIWSGDPVKRISIVNGAILKVSPATTNQGTP